MTCCETCNSDEKMTNESALTVFGIRSCDTCRRAQKYLTDHNIEFRFHDLRVDGLDIQTLERWSDRIGWEKLLNRQSLTWRKIPEIDKAQITRSRALGMMIDQPTLIKRPVLESKEFIAVGFSEKRFADFIEGLA
jgi:Spx/MgsR family transcriptional regulator